MLGSGVDGPTITVVALLLSLTDGLPEHRMEGGDVLVAEGSREGRFAVLVTGRLEVRKGDVVVAEISEPGACIGEVSLLTGSPATATVVATGPAVVRVADDGDIFLRSSPEVLAEVARILAGRLHRMTTYLADLRRQYGDQPGLQMVGEVLSTLNADPGPAPRPGSARDPDPLY